MIYGYLRVSSDEQDVNSQKQGVDKFAAERGWTIGKYITDEGVSGGKDPDKRNLGPLLNIIQKGDVIISSEISRLGRDLYMVMDILHFCMERGCVIYTVKDKFVLGDDIQSKVLAFAFGAFCGKGRGVAFPEIGYGFYPVFAQFFSLDATPVPVKEDMSVDAAAFKGLSQTVVIANPNAQTGIYLPLSDIETLLSENKDRLVIVDEAYCDFGAESAVGLVGRYDNLLVVQTMSKSRQLAGGRVGFAIGSEEVIADLNAMKFSFNPYNLNRLSILAGAAAVEDEEYFLSATAAVIEERERLKKEFGKLGFESTPSLANFLLVRRGGIGGRELYLALKQKGVLVRWLGGRLSDYVRITVGSREQNDVLIAAVREILKEKSI